MATTPLTAFTTGIGVVSYGDYTLVPARNYRFTVEPVYSDSDRTVVYNKCTLSGKWVTTETAEGDSSTTLTLLRKELSKPGQLLTLNSIGYVGTLIADVHWGPKPRVISLTPVGGLLCWEVDWTCEFYIPECSSTSLESGKILAFEYETETSINNGYTTNRTTGYWQIAQVRDGILVRERPDEKRELLKITVPPGFKRTASSFRTSQDQTRTTFSVTDEELQTLPFPKGIIDADINYSVSNQGRGFVKWNAELSGHMEVARGISHTEALAKFVAIAHDKVRTFRTRAGSYGVVIPERFKFSKGLFTRRSQFSVTWTVVGCMKNVVQASGMYDELPDSNYASWATSVKHLWTNRGPAKLHHPLTAIVDVCDNSTIPSLTSGATYNKDPDGKVPDLFDCSGITEGNSWLAWQNQVRYVHNQRYAWHRFIQDHPVAAVIVGGLFGGLAGAALAGALAQSDGGILQAQGPPDDIIIMYGKAMRVKFEPDIPSLKKIGGAAPVLTREHIEPAIVVGAVGDNCPVYAARWAKVYIVPFGFRQPKIEGGDNPIMRSCAIPFSA